jgi:hypothetical protein
MPNYANTIMYQIICDGECYVGHTVDFKRRKKEHTNRWSNETNDYKLYVFIREHGGWDSCEMSIIENYPCENKTEALIREEFWRVKKNANLNTVKCYLTKEQIKAIHSIHHSKWRNNNKEKVNNNSLEWYYANKEKELIRQQKYREEHKEKQKEYMKIWYQKKKAQKALELVDSSTTTNSPC